MKINPISSTANSLLKKVRGLQERSFREKSRQFLLEGPRPVQEAISRGLPLDQVIASNSFFHGSADFIADLNLAQLSLVDDKAFAELHETSSSCGILAVAEIPKYTIEDVFEKQREPLIVVCDGIQDPGNLGTIVRSAYAAEAAGLLLTRGCVDVYSPKVVRSAVGALFEMPLLYDLAHDECLKLLADKQIPLRICEASAPNVYCQADYTKACAIALGNEARGICAEFSAAAADSVSIPMRIGSESLNVGVSAGIILCEAYRQRTGVGCKA